MALKHGCRVGGPGGEKKIGGTVSLTRTQSGRMESAARKCLVPVQSRTGFVCDAFAIIITVLFKFDTCITVLVQGIA
jgi:hypothetical protein